MIMLPATSGATSEPAKLSSWCSSMAGMVETLPLVPSTSSSGILTAAIGPRTGRTTCAGAVPTPMSGSPRVRHSPVACVQAWTAGCGGAAAACQGPPAALSRSEDPSGECGRLGWANATGAGGGSGIHALPRDAGRAATGGNGRLEGACRSVGGLDGTAPAALITDAVLTTGRGWRALMDARWGWAAASTCVRRRPRAGQPAGAFDSAELDFRSLEPPLGSGYCGLGLPVEQSSLNGSGCEGGTYDMFLEVRSMTRCAMRGESSTGLWKPRVAFGMGTNAISPLAGVAGLWPCNPPGNLVLPMSSSSRGRLAANSLATSQ
mmetsp:Transcript_71126/g.212086  ORF Transcript_71126/g.212086 Transcript_71126/m.212086 type:complete len:320 (-) Transcript_71126:193-1152(-)